MELRPPGASVPFHIDRGARDVSSRWRLSFQEGRGEDAIDDRTPDPDWERSGSLFNVCSEASLATYLDIWI